MSDDIKAGEYELVALQWDQQTSKPGEPFDFVRHRAGDRVTLDVEEAHRLVRAGAVAKPGERERQRVTAAQAALAASLAALPADLRDAAGGDVAAPEAAQSERPTSGDDQAGPPKRAKPAGRA